MTGAAAANHAAITRFRRGTLAFHRRQERPFAWRTASDPYAVLIGEILLQRTTRSHVLAVYRDFLDRFPAPAQLAASDPEELAEALRPLGMAKRVGFLLRLGRELILLRRVPTSPIELERLPGVGRYTSHAVPVFAAHRNFPLVDWVIARVLRRYFGVTSAKRPNADEDLWQLATKVANIGRAREVWLGTLDLAAAVCRRIPQCEECPLWRTCAYANASAPKPSPRSASPQLRARSLPPASAERRSRSAAPRRSSNRAT